MRQVCILREHTVRNLEATRIFHLVLSLESIKVTFFLHYIERFYGVNMLFAILSRISSHQFQTDSIVQALLVDNISNGVFLTALDGAFHQVFGLFARHHFNAVPLLGNFFLPSSYFLSLGTTVGSQHLETFGLLDVELVVIVVQLTLHCIVGSNLCDGVLDSLHPTFRISLLVACIEQRQNFLLKNAVDSSGIELVLMFLVLVSTLFSQRPTCTFTVTFQPPSV